MAIKVAVNRALTAITALPTAAALTDGNLTLLTTATASSSATLTFDSNINSTYNSYLFKFIDIHPASNADFTVNFRDGSTAYDATKTTTFFHAQHNEAGDYTNFAYQTGNDVAQGTGSATVARKIGTGNDESCAGELILFNPSSTTFVKHFISRAFAYQYISAQYNSDNYGAGYCNVTAAIDGVQFAMSSGNIDAGTIKMYGVGDKQS
jgi:hypothetical protein